MKTNDDRKKTLLFFGEKSVCTCNQCVFVLFVLTLSPEPVTRQYNGLQSQIANT